MSIRLRPALAVCLLAVLVASGFSRGSSQEQPIGTGRITVVVVADDNGAPVKRAGVLLSGIVLPPGPPGGLPLAAATLTTSSVSQGGGVVTGSGPVDPCRSRSPARAGA